MVCRLGKGVGYSSVIPVTFFFLFANDQWID